jgi:hypothetical protein
LCWRAAGKKRRTKKEKEGGEGEAGEANGPDPAAEGCDANVLRWLQQLKLEHYAGLFALHEVRVCFVCTALRGMFSGRRDTAAGCAIHSPVYTTHHPVSESVMASVACSDVDVLVHGWVWARPYSGVQAAAGSGCTHYHHQTSSPSLHHSTSRRRETAPAS